MRKNGINRCGENFQSTRIYREVFILNVRNSKTSLLSKLLQIFNTYVSHLFFEAFESYRPCSVRPSKMSSTKTNFSHLLYEVSIMGLTKFFVILFEIHCLVSFKVETLLRALSRFLWKSKQNVPFFEKKPCLILFSFDQKLLTNQPQTFSNKVPSENERWSYLWRSESVVLKEYYKTFGSQQQKNSNNLVCNLTSP